MTTELDAAIFDFGGVLTTPIRASFAAYEGALGVPEGSLLRAFIHHPTDAEPAYFLLEKGLISEAEFYEGMLERLREHTGLAVSWPGDPADVRRKLFGQIGPNDALIAAALSINEHYKTAILTNNVREWSDWRTMVSADAFDLVIDSSHVGLRKPDPEIYLLTCRQLGVEPARAAFVDDLELNVTGASAVGMTAIRFTSTEDVLAALRPLFPRAFVANEMATVERDEHHA